jgi:hypothetical protein
MAVKTAGDVQAAVIQTQGFQGGVNIRDVVSQLAPNELRASENGTLDEGGGWSKRLGCISNGNAPGNMLSMYTFYRGTTNVPQVLIHCDNGGVYYTTDATANPVVWTAIATGLSTTARMAFETFNSKCYFTNGVDSYASWSGSAYATYASAPKGKYLRLYKDTMWMAGITGNDDRVYSSVAGDAETWPAAAWVDITKGDGDFITCLGSDGLVLIVTKRNRIMTIYDPTTFANRVIDFEKGCESHFSMIQFEGDIFFLSRRGVAKFDNSGPALIISNKLDPLFSPSTLNLNALSNVFAYVYQNQIGWSLPEIGNVSMTIQIEYYPRLGPMTLYGTRLIGPWVFHRMPVGMFTRVRVGTTDFLYGGHSTTTKFLSLFAPIGTDDGATFTALMETGPLDFGQPTRTKYIRRLRLLGRGQVTLQLRRNFQTAIYKTVSLDMSAGADLWTTIDIWGVGTWGPDSLLKEALWNADAYGRYFQLRFSDTSTGVGKKLIEVGSREYTITAGEWAVYLATLEGDVLGLRG